MYTGCLIIYSPYFILLGLLIKSARTRWPGCVACVKRREVTRFCYGNLSEIEVYVKGFKIIGYERSL